MTRGLGYGLTIAGLLWLGLFGLILFVSYDAPLSRRRRQWWLIGSAAVATMLTVPVLMILLAAELSLGI